jgi:hypothetical protein
MITEIGMIIEIGVPNSIANRYKTEKGLEDKVRKEIYNFLSNWIDVGEVKVEHIRDKFVDIIEINNFNYCCYYQAEQNKDYRVFRHFGCNIFTTDKFILSDNHYWYDMGEYKICVVASSCTCERKIDFGKVQPKGSAKDYKLIL